jgi:hypothetical protein
MANARRTGAKQKDLMLFNDKSIRHHFMFFQRTPGKLQGLVARPTVEVVMMSLSGSFI